MGGNEGLDLSVPQIAGSALAAATAAVAASFLGVTGTIIGAAVASAATTVGNAVYTHYIKRTRDHLVEAHGLIAGQRAPEEPEEAAAGVRPGEEGLALAVHATVREHGPADLPPAAGEAVPVDAGTVETLLLRKKGTRGSLWTTLIVATVASFALSMGGILAFELLSGRPLAATVHGETGSGTSWGGTVDEPKSPAPSPSPSTGRASSSPVPKVSGGASSKPEPTTGGSARPSVQPSSSAPESTSAGTVPPTAGTGGEGQGDG
jgi:hypothetical protein